MTNRAWQLLLAMACTLHCQDWQIASPGYHYEFPKDYFAHPHYQTEWWYYTGNLRTRDGHRYGFELTFFREGERLSKQATESESQVWLANDLYLAHSALSDIDGKRFYHFERLNRAGPGLAGISAQPAYYWNGNWQVSWTDSSRGIQELTAITRIFRLQLHLDPEKSPVIHGSDGVSRKGPAYGQASHYFSLTRIRTTGRVDLGGKTEDVIGVAWMDHEFFTEPPDSDLRGWDWFAIQLDNHCELMIYRLRGKSGVESPYSSGTYVDEAGKAHFLNASDFILSPQRTWVSPHSGAKYPVSWLITVPSLSLSLSERTEMDDQELTETRVSPGYWEGAVLYEGTIGRKPAKGSGYLEMTGYVKSLKLAGMR